MGRLKPNLLLSSIMRQYRLRAQFISPCRSHYRKIAGYRVYSNKGEFFLKPFIGKMSRLNRVYARISGLQRQGFHKIPEWIMTSGGNRWVTDHNRLYYVTKWISGSKLGQKEKEYEQLGETMGRLHLLSRWPKSVSPSHTLKEMNRFKLQHRIFSLHLLKVQKKKGAISAWFREHGEQCLTLAEEAWMMLRQPSIRTAMRIEKPSIIHGDVTRSNVIVSADGIYLIDWEFTRRGSSYYEVAKTLNNVTGYTVSHMQAFLAGYERSSPLTMEERRMIAALFRLPREVWIAARVIRAGKYSSLFKSLADSWKSRLEAIHWMDGWADK